MPARPQVIEQCLVTQRIHALPITIVPIGGQLAIGGEVLKCVGFENANASIARHGPLYAVVPSSPQLLFDTGAPSEKCWENMLVMLGSLRNGRPPNVMRAPYATPRVSSLTPASPTRMPDTIVPWREYVGVPL